MGQQTQQLLSTVVITRLFNNQPFTNLFHNMDNTANAEHNDTLNRNKQMFQIITPDNAEAFVGICVFFEEEKKGQKCIHVNWAVKSTAECLNISTRTVLGVCKKLKEGEAFPKAEMHHHDMAVPEDMIAMVWSTIMKMYQGKLNVTLDTLLVKLKKRVATRQSG